MRNGRIYSTYGYKVICSRQLPDDAALCSRAIALSILPSLKEMKPLTDEEMRRIAEEFQSRLLMFRLTHYSAVRHFRAQPCDLDDMTPRAWQLARVLLAPLQGDERAQTELIALLRDRDLDTQVERFLEPEWLVVEALFAIDHEQLPNRARYSEILVGGVADEVNEILDRRGEGFTLKARQVGAVLKSLGFKTERIGNLGRGFRITQGFHRKVHELARQLGIDRTHIAAVSGLENGYGGAPCALCEEFGLTAGLRFVDLVPQRLRRPLSSTRIPLFDKRNRDKEPVRRSDVRARAEKA